MMKNDTFKMYNPYLLLLSLILVTFVLANPVQAQEGDLPQDLIREVGFDQKLDSQVPLDLVFTDSTGKKVELGDYFDEKPVILTLGYYECPMLCALVRNGLFDSLKGLDFTVGEEFSTVIVSIDHRETPEVAEIKRRASITEYAEPGRTISEEGWNFLVGDEEAIAELAEAIGFRYTYDPKIDQYLHPAGIVVLTPEGRVSKYFYGIEYPARTLRLGLVEAADNKIGSPVDQLLLMCYHYDPVEGEYTIAIMNILRIAGVVTVVVIGGMLFILSRRSSAVSASSTSA